MLQIRRSAERGHFDHGWLSTYHTFSFSEYMEPAWMRFRSLRVMNEDVVQPGQGFGTHGHRDMEIITHVLSGQLEHRDSLGNGGVLTPGELQHMTAGTGIRHSEFNPSTTEPVHLYQIWILPESAGLTPAYSQKRFDPETYRNKFALVASPDGREGSLSIRQDVLLHLGQFDAAATANVSLGVDRHAWLQVLRGEAVLNGESLQTGDGVAVSDVADLNLAFPTAAEIMLFELA